MTYLIAGLPVLARINPGTDLAHLMYQKNVGYAYDGTQVEPLKKFIEELIDSPDRYQTMSENGQKLAREMFDPTQIVKQILTILP